MSIQNTIATTGSLNNNNNNNTANVIYTTEDNTTTTNFLTYQNSTYGVALKYPPD